MSLRIKFAIAAVALAAGSAITVGLLSYTWTEHSLRSQIESSLTEAASRYERDDDGPPDDDRPHVDRPSAADGDGDEYPRSFTQILVQILDADGQIVIGPRSGDLPISDRDIAIATSRDPDGSAGRRAFSDVVLDGEEYRMLTASTPTGAVQVARSMDETDRLVEHVLKFTIWTMVGMSAVALVLSWLIAQQVTRRLVRLTDLAVGVAASGRLDVEVPVDGNDETGKLGKAFHDMLSSLARSKRSQYQLVQDAGHELRTPLTSLRTNVSVMRRFGELSPGSQQRLLDDLESETRELTDLVNELVQLATDQRDDEVPATVVLADLARQVVDRAVRRTGREITLVADDASAVVRQQAVERAMTNVVGNALKFSSGPVEVILRAGRFDVLDRGPGIGDDDPMRLFDRFHRAVEARSLPGSGLGLAIVREVAESHGGTVHAANRDGGGAAIGFTVSLTRTA